MAYCVHCGVKIHDSEKKCPLCGTAVYDPAAPDRAADRPYPAYTEEQVLKRSMKFLLLLALLLTLLPAALCLLVDLLVSTDGLSWSVYPSAALALLFIAFAVPMLAKHYRTYKSLAVDFLTISAYLFMIERVNGHEHWFFPVVLPCLALATALATVILFLFRSGRLNKLTLTAAAFAGIGVMSLAIEIIIRLSERAMMYFIWSPYVAAPCLFISGAFFLVNGNRAAREEFRRRVHF